MAVARRFAVGGYRVTLVARSGSADLWANPDARRSADPRCRPASRPGRGH